MLSAYANILQVLVVVLAIWLLLIKAKLFALQRSIYIADLETGFLKELEKWDASSRHCPFDAGIDPHSVYSSISNGWFEGRRSIESEKRKYGNIKQL